MKDKIAFLISLLLLLPVLRAQEETPAEPYFDVDSLETALTEPDRESAASLFSTCVAEHGEIGPLVACLDQVAASAAEKPERLAAANLLKGYALWQFGDMKAAGEAFEQAQAATPAGLEARLARATILDSLGQAKDALEAYEALLPELLGSPQELSVRMTVALLALEEGGEERKNALAECAAGLSAGERNRAAVVLALLDRPADALALFEPREKPKDRVRDLLRMAGWALQSEQFAIAATHAWEASFLAPMARDRWQALALVTEARIAEDTLGGLLEWFVDRQDLTPQHQQVWTDVLRQTGNYDLAIARFENSSGQDLSPEARLELLELYREAGREPQMLAAYGDLIEAERMRVLWRAGLSRVLLEKGDAAGALEVWEGFAEGAAAPRLMEGAQALAGLGLVDLAREWGLRCEEDPRTQVAAQLFLFALERDGGRVAQALEVLQRMEEGTDPGSPARMELSEAFEQVGALEDAVRVLESVKATRPEGEAGEDLEMRLAWLYSEVEQEEKALEAWRELWLRIEALSRRRYVEDRLMTVSSRLGNLADLAIELEQAVLAGTASEKQSALLVRLYTRVGDSVSATEVVDEFFRHAGKGERSSLEEKARIYLATHDYHSYEEAVWRLIELDPEGEPDYLRQLAMSMMERGKPRQARDVLGRLSELETDTLAAEFEAGVLALAGMREEALVVYRKGLADHPGRIDGYLLMGDLLKQTGDQDLALGMFQYLAAHAERDDLFTVAIDGILNQFSDGGVRSKTIAWARRATLMRLALRHDKTYLYQLLADLHEEEQDRVGMIRAHETSLPITGPRVASVLRELMDLSRGEGDSFRGSGWKGDPDLFLHYGRRLVASGELVPPQVYLDLGEAFLDADDPEAARRTFALTKDMPDHARYQREAAGLFERAGETQIALDSYQAILATAPTDESLLVKVGELHEAMGQDERAADLYQRGLSLLLARRPLEVTKKAEEELSNSPFIWYGARNTDDWDRWSERLLTGLLAASPPAAVGAAIEQLHQAQLEDLTQIRSNPARPDDDVLAAHPRVDKRAGVLRRLAFALGDVSLADHGDELLMETFPLDEALFKGLIRARLGQGYLQSAVALLDHCSLTGDSLAVLRTLAGADGPQGASGGEDIGVRQAAREVLPQVAVGNRQAARDLVQRAQYGQAKKEDLTDLTVLFSAARWLGDSGLTLRVGRQWVRLTMNDGGQSYMVEQIIEQVAAGLDDEGKRALYQYFVGRVVEDPAKNAGMLLVISNLQRKSEQPLLSEEQVLELLDSSGRTWGLPQLLTLLPARSRVAALRSNWSKVPVTGRANLLVDLVGVGQEEVNEDMAEFIVDHAEEAFREAPEFIRYVLRNLSQVKSNQETALALLEIWSAEHPDDSAVEASRAVLLHVLDHVDEAVALGVKILPKLAPTEGTQDWEIRNARQQLLKALAPDHADELSASLGDLEPRQAFDLRLELLREDQEAKRELWATVLGEFPDDQKLLKQAILHVPREQQLELLDRLLELAEKDKDKVALLKRREGLLRSRGYYADALVVREQRVDLDQGGGEESEKSSPVRSGMIQVGPGTYISSSAFGGSEKMSDEDLPSDAHSVCTALDEERTLDAAHTLRRHWRQFQTGLKPAGGNIFFSRYSWSPMSQFQWTGKSPDEDEEESEGSESEETPKPISMGGLSSWKDEIVKQEVVENPGLKALTGEPLLVAELERFLQTTQVEQLDRLQGVVEALALVDEGALGAQEAIAQRVTRMEEGQLGKRGQMELLQMLDRHPTNQSGRVVARELVQAVSPKDAAQVRRLARVLARSGAQEEALRLYRWCATRISGQRIFFGFMEEEGSTVTVQDLVKEAREVIDEQYRLALVEQILELSPVSPIPWMREAGELNWLKIWEEMLGPQEALARARTICDESIDLSTGLRRGVSLRAASLFAHGGEFDKALRALEIGICKLPPESVTQTSERWYQVDTERPGNFSSDNIRRLLAPELVCEGDNAAALRLALETNLLTWLADERASESSLIRALCVLGLRCEQVGDTAALTRIAQALADREKVLDHLPLWVADLCARAGLEQELVGIEERLLADGKLHSNRRVPALERILAAGAPARALQQASACADRSRVKGLCAFLSQAAAASGDEALSQQWQAAGDADTQAQQRLKEMDEADKAAAEAKKKAQQKGQKGKSAARALTPAVRLKRIGP